MTWLIITIVMIMAVGPILYLMPTPSDKRLTALRMQARKAGMAVKITSIPKLDPAGHERVSAGGEVKDPRTACVAYELPMGQSVQGVGEHLLLRIPAQPTMPLNEVMAGWSLHEECDVAKWQGFTADVQTVEDLQKALERLPEDMLACAINEKVVACYWREKADPAGTSVAVICTALDHLRADVTRRFGVEQEA